MSSVLVMSGIIIVSLIVVPVDFVFLQILQSYMSQNQNELTEGGKDIRVSGLARK